MKRLLRLLVLSVILGCLGTVYARPIPPESVGALAAKIEVRLKEPARDTLPTMDLHQIIRDIIFEGREYFEEN